MDFFQADGFAVERLTEKRLLRVEAKGARVADAADFQMGRVFGWCDAFGIRTA